MPHVTLPQLSIHLISIVKINGLQVRLFSGRMVKKIRVHCQCVLFETNYNVRGSNIYGRCEFVQRLRDDLGIVNNDHSVEPVHPFTLGYSHPLASFVGLDLSIAAQATYNVLASGLKEYYGNSPYGAQIYISLHPNLGM